MPQFVSYAQNGEDVRLWHAFGPTNPASDEFERPLTYVEVGANYPRDLSISAALYDLGWRGLLVEADPQLAQQLRIARPGDEVVQVAAASSEGELTFFQIPGTGLGTLDEKEAQAAAERGFEVHTTRVSTRTIDSVLDDFLGGESQGQSIQALTIDVEGAEQEVLAGLSLTRHRPWVLCVEAIDPGTHRPTHDEWEAPLLDREYRFVAFDGINRWYVAHEHADEPVAPTAGAPAGTTIAEAIATPLHALDIGIYGWRTAAEENLRSKDRRSHSRQAWQREIVMNELRSQVRDSEYEQRIIELDAALAQVQASRSYALSRKISGAGRKAFHLAQRTRTALPSALADRLVRHRHLGHVTTNMADLTDPAFLEQATEDSVSWGAEESIPRPPVPPGLALKPLTAAEVDSVRTWLHNNPFDHDDELDARMDNLDDEVGRARSALRTRVRIAESQVAGSAHQGTRVAFDARALQSPAFGTRGIGRFAAAALAGVREAVGDEWITLIVDHGAHRLPEELAGHCTQVSWIREDEIAAFGLLIEPSPMTHSPDPVLPLLLSEVPSVAIVFDFIPRHFPGLYLSSIAQRLEYAASLDALRHYTDFICISNMVSEELAGLLAQASSIDRPATRSVAWPREIAEVKHHRVNAASPNAPIVLMTGDEPRKNTFGGLAGIAAATVGEEQRNVVIVGMAGLDDRVHHWSIAAAMRPGEARTLGRVSDAELTEVLTSASLVVVPSFDEGLSLPVIEAAYTGVPVAASDIPAHRELIGSGVFLFDPRDPASISRAVIKARGSRRLADQQRGNLASHRHQVLEKDIAARIDQYLPARSRAGSTSPHPSRQRRRAGERLKVAVATPWEPQRSGVADYSTTVFTELANHVDLTVFTTSDARVETPKGIEQRDLEGLLADPQAAQDFFDAIVVVVGNSHFHLPFVQLLAHLDAIVIAHDTRMVEFYMALRGKGGVRRLMLTQAGSPQPAALTPALDDQIQDMRLLQNAGLWEVANRSEVLVLHSPSAAPLISEQTGRPAQVLPFANYRAPEYPTITDAMRQDARKRLGLDRYPEGTIHLASFGYIDVRTKMTDVVVETAAWLQQWGYRVAMHLVGSASPEIRAEIEHHAASSRIDNLTITGYQTEEQYRDWLLAADLGVQLRISPMLGVSGPLSDMAAYGTPAVASSGLCLDVDTPNFIYRLPDVVSPVIVAEAIEAALAAPMSASERERSRLAYLEAKAPSVYAERLLALIEDASTTSSKAPFAT